MTGHDNAYEGLVEADDDARWAFGTSFDDPLLGVDTTVPSGVDGSALAAYCLMLADDSLVLAQRLAEWTTHAPEIEEEVALANIGLDLLGQARLLLARAAAADPAVVPTLPEDSPVPQDDRLAYFRDADAFRNVGLVAQPNGDFAATMTRLLVFSAWRLALLERLRASIDPVLAAVAEKGVKEVRYHREHAARWCITLAQGTDVSRERMIAGTARGVARCHRARRGERRGTTSARTWPPIMPPPSTTPCGSSTRCSWRPAWNVPTSPPLLEVVATDGTPSPSASSSPACKASRATTRWAGGDSAGT